MSLTIAIDLDRTWTEAPTMWRSIRELMLRDGHAVVMVTARRDPVSADERVRYRLPDDMPIVYTAGDFKERHALKAGYKVDIWIDDAPGMIQECAIIKVCPDTDL